MKELSDERNSREKGFKTTQVKRLYSLISLSPLTKLLSSYIPRIPLGVVSLMCIKTSESLLKCRFLGLICSLLNPYAGVCILTSSSGDVEALSLNHI